EGRRAELFETPRLEGVLDRLRHQRGLDVRREAADQLDRSELADHVGAAERIGEVAGGSVDARHGRAEQELVAEDLVPERVDLGGLREEAMPAEIEPEA